MNMYLTALKVLTRPSPLSNNKVSINSNLPPVASVLLLWTKRLHADEGQIGLTDKP